jgi:hypothetical protein
LPEFFVGGSCTQAEQCPPFRPAEGAGNGAAAGDFYSLQLAPAAVEANESVFFEGCERRMKASMPSSVILAFDERTRIRTSA